MKIKVLQQLARTKSFTINLFGLYVKYLHFKKHIFQSNISKNSKNFDKIIFYI